MFSGARGFQFNVIDDTLGVAANNNLQDYLRYRVPDLKLHKGSFGVFQPIFKEPFFIFVPTLLFINEMDMTIDTSGGFGDAMSLVNMSDVAYVKYIPGLVIGGTFRSTSGAIYIYTKTGREKGPPVKGLPFVYIKGYNQQKEFINPNYYDKDLLKQPDLRATLYWNPNVIMDKTNNKVQIEYYNNDISKKLLLTIEGVNAFGKLIHIEKIIE